MTGSDRAAWRVHKFGGSSVADAACFERVAQILEASPDEKLAVVLSACRGVTDALYRLVLLAEQQQEGVRGELDALRARHATVATTVLDAKGAVVRRFSSLAAGEQRVEPSEPSMRGPMWCSRSATCRTTSASPRRP